MRKAMEKVKSVMLAVMLLSLLVVGTTSCDDDDPEVIEPVDVSYVSLYHASPNAPALDIFLNNRQVNYLPLRYSNYTGYLNVYSGARNMRVSPAAAENVILDTTLTFLVDRAYSLFYVNNLSDIEALLIRDSTVTPAAGQAAVRFVHLSPDAPAVDVIRIDENRNTLLSDLAYLQASPFMMVESGLQSFEVNLANGSTAVLNIPDVTLLPGGIYTVVAKGYATPPPGNNNVLSADILLNN